MEQAIKLAIEKGGYSPTFAGYKSLVTDSVALGEEGVKAVMEFMEQEHFSPNGVLLDPLFWQALGRGVGGGMNLMTPKVTMNG